jgi:hypothetical protein
MKPQLKARKISVKAIKSRSAIIFLHENDLIHRVYALQDQERVKAGGKSVKNPSKFKGERCKLLDKFLPKVVGFFV